MSTCAGITQAGGRCTLAAKTSSGMCWLHDPDRADQRHRHASKAARSKGNKEVAILKGDVRDVIAGVRDGNLDRGDAAVMLQGFRVLKDLVELDRKVRETDDLLEQVEELKQRINPPNQRGRARAW